MKKMIVPKRTLIIGLFLLFLTVFINSQENNSSSLESNFPSKQFNSLPHLIKSMETQRDDLIEKLN